MSKLINKPCLRGIHKKWRKWWAPEIKGMTRQIMYMAARELACQFLVCMWRHGGHVGGTLTKECLLSSIVLGTNMAAMSLYFESPGIDCKPSIQKRLRFEPKHSILMMSISPEFRHRFRMVLYTQKKNSFKTTVNSGSTLSAILTQTKMITIILTRSGAE